MRRYIPVADRKAAEAKESLRTGLQKIADDPQSTNGQKLEALSRLADLHISEEKAVPLRQQIEEQGKNLRALREQLQAATNATTDAQEKIAELEKVKADLTQERDGLEEDVARLGSALSDSRTALNVAEENTRQSAQRLSEVNKRADNLLFSISALVNRFRDTYMIPTFPDSLVMDLFFALNERAFPEIFTSLGWDAEKFVFWQGWLKKANHLTTEQIIDVLHRSQCPCSGHQPETTIRDNGTRRVLTDDDRVFLKAFIRSRGTDPELEITKLVGQHSKEWFDKNRRPLQLTPPVSHREITPLAGDRIVHWGED